MPDSSIILPSRVTILATLVMLLAAMSMSILACGAISAMLHNSLSDTAGQYLQTTDNIIDESQQILQHLNSLPAHQCREENLRHMRRLLLTSRYIRDIHYATEQEQCSASEGRQLQPPLPDSLFFAGDSQIWLNQPLTPQSDITAALIRQHDYWLTIISETLTTPPHRYLNWQIVNVTQTEPVHVAGTPALFNTTSNNDNAFQGLTRTGYQYQQCSAVSGFCLTMEYAYLQLIRHYPFLFVSIASMLLLLSCTAFHLCRRFMNRKFTLSYRVRAGLKSGAYSIVFQPIIHLRSQQVVGCEVLTRFQDKLGTLGPQHFIPELSRQKLSACFTISIARQALQQISSLPQLPSGFHLALNVYPEDIASGGLLKLLELPEVKQRQVKLVLEITEQQELMYHHAQQHLTRLKAAGIQISIDDFGTGYSNLSSLRALKADYLKIDKSFVQDMEADSIKSSLIPKIREIAHLLHYQVVAEGIENLSQATLLCHLGIELGQGWHFAKAMPLTELHHWLHHAQTLNTAQQPEAETLY
ncbi:EAL domain-containing protein [Chromatiaceae bacterium AAb-1]|nr:EAL domain-containing protein [Chromatiaceae bacterium AAb-1]